MHSPASSISSQQYDYCCSYSQTSTPIVKIFWYLPRVQVSGFRVQGSGAWDLIPFFFFSPIFSHLPSAPWPPAPWPSVRVQGLGTLAEGHEAENQGAEGQGAGANELGAMGIKARGWGLIYKWYYSLPKV